MVKKKEFLILFLLLLFAGFFIYIYVYIKQTQEEIFTRIENNKIQEISYIFHNIEKNIIEENNINTTNDLISLLSTQKIRKEYEQHISLISTPSIKYVYLLVKDERGRFRYLLDASQTDKANFFEKFDVDNKKYNDIYITKEKQVIRQKNIENLFLTFLYPIKSNGKVIAILSADITTKIRNTVLELIKPLEMFFVILIIFIFLIMIILVMQIFYYILTRKKIFTDPLTQIFNRNYLNEIYPTINLRNYSVAMLDLDKFKIINDTYGHKTGDGILYQSTQVIKNSIRDNDILIRYGGEEFLLFINSRSNDKYTLDVCQRILENIYNHTFSVEDNDIHMSVSIGLHKTPHLEKNLHEALKIADKMLYVAKSQGRNRVIEYNDTPKKENTEKSIDINFVKDAISENRVVCYYQPIYDFRNHIILKYEALVRIIDTQNNIIPPYQFLDLVKQTNVHYKLTQRILSIIFNKFKNNNDKVSININFSDLINKDIMKKIIDSLKEDHNLASRITFEILKSDEIQDIELFKEKIKQLHSVGTKVSIDDFGSGYSNFRTILDIEANFLKIDGSLIKNIDKNEKDFKVVKSIIHFAKESNMQTIAEYVHSKDVYDKLKELELDYMQGYYISEPKEDLQAQNNLFA